MTPQTHVEDPTNKAPTWEEEAELFASTALAHVKMPCCNPPFNNISYTAAQIKQAVNISSARDFIEDEANLETEELFVGVPRVRMPPNGPITYDNGTNISLFRQDQCAEGMALFTDDVTAIVRLPQTEVSFNFVKTASDARQTMSVPSPWILPPDVGLAPDNDLFQEEVIRVKLQYQRRQARHSPPHATARVT